MCDGSVDEEHTGLRGKTKKYFRGLINKICKGVSDGK